MAFKHSKKPSANSQKEIDSFINSAEPVNNPDEVSGIKDPAILAPPSPPGVSPAISEMEPVSSPGPSGHFSREEEGPSAVFSVRSVDYFERFDNEHPSHSVNIRFTERDREMFDYCLRIGKHRSKQGLIVDAVRKAMRDLILAQQNQ